jgi:hypothetical protein
LTLCGELNLIAFSVSSDFLRVTILIYYPDIDTGFFQIDNFFLDYGSKCDGIWCILEKGAKMKNKQPKFKTIGSYSEE